MQNDMELKNANDHQTWDLSHRSKQETNSESEGESKSSQNYSALDLSRKNSVTSTTITGTNKLRSCLFRSLPAQQIHPNRPDQHSNLTDVEKQSPFTSDIMLSSSSSESDSAKETTECGVPSFYNIRSNIANNIPLFVPPGVTIGMPFLPLPSYLNSEAIKIPVATSTIASTFTSPTETSSLQTNRAAEKNPLEFMNGPLNQEMSTPSVEVIKKTPRPFKAYSKSPFPALKRHIDTAFTSTAEEKDAAYWERRKKNNEAAKRSRDARRAKEDELAIWATYLENENTRLKSELTGLHCLLQQLGYDINQIKKYKHW